MPPRSKWSLLGIPDHQAVTHVCGRIGAARGPRVFRRIFGALKGRDGVHETCQDFGDAGPIGPDVAENHQLAAALLARAHGAVSGVSVVVGGAHDHGFSQLKGIRDFDVKKTLGCLNIDAHLDVRKPAPLITSGSPFYLALESGVLDPSRFVEFGIQTHCNGPELWDYVESHKISVVPFARLRDGGAPAAFRQALIALSAVSDRVVISLDLDAAAQAYAPGVSAPQAEGFSSREIVEFCEIAGAEPRVVSLGLFELNPEHDIDDRTARLAATCAYHFVAAALKR